MSDITDLDKELNKLLTVVEGEVHISTNNIVVSLPLQLAAEIIILLLFDAAMDFLLCFVSSAPKQSVGNYILDMTCSN